MKRIICFAFALLLLVSCSSCACSHEWKDATCASPKTCTLCGEKEGTAASHTWIDATCVAPKTCSSCGETEGEVSLLHSYEGDKCKHCGLIQLTLYNYEDYIDCDATVRCGDSYYNSSYGYIYTGAECSFKATGNSHYKYDNVIITIKFSHYDQAGYKQYWENQASMLVGKPITKEATPYSQRTCKISLNLAGNGSASCELYTPWSNEKYAYSKSSTVFDRTVYEVVSISGTVQEY